MQTDRYPFWEIGEDLYKESYTPPSVEYAPEEIQTTVAKDKAIDFKLQEIYDNIRIWTYSYPKLYTYTRTPYNSSYIVEIHLSLSGDALTNKTYIHNHNILKVYGTLEQVYKVGQVKFIGYNTNIHIETVWRHRDLNNVLHEGGNFPFSYEKLYEILKDCEAEWNPEAFTK